jgi:hypothetical protein
VTVADPTVMPALEAILAAMRVELAKVADPPAHFRHAPGLSAVIALTEEGDECCEGVAWVRLTGVLPTTEFPEEAGWQPDGEVSWAVETEIGVARCGGGPGAEMAPTDAQYLADVQKLADDAAALRRVGPNLRATSTAVIDVMYGRWDPVAAEGNCMGGVIKLTVQIEACDAGQAG